jgi:hypothetical protein
MTPKRVVYRAMLWITIEELTNAFSLPGTHPLRADTKKNRNRMKKYR